MGISIPGTVGVLAEEQFAKQLAQKLLREKQDAALQQQEFENAIRMRDLSMREEDQRWQTGERTRIADERETAKLALANMADIYGSNMPIDQLESEVGRFAMSGGVDVPEHITKGIAGKRAKIADVKLRGQYPQYSAFFDVGVKPTAAQIEEGQLTPEQKTAKRADELKKLEEDAFARAQGTGRGGAPFRDSGGGTDESGMTPNEGRKLAQERLLANEFERRAGPALAMKRAYSIMESGLAAARQGDMNAGSQAVIMTFNKILDPNSVVRESEYARSAAGLSLAAQIQGALEKVRTGGAGMTVEELENFADLARTFTENSLKEFQPVRDRYKKKAEDAGLDADFVAPDISIMPSRGGDSGGGAAGGAGTSPSGESAFERWRKRQGGK